jgi:exodeoxyribonuclease VII small subunit
MTAQSQKESLPNFETAISELESIVNQMETGNLPLEASLNAYMRGAELLQICQKSLTDAEQQVRLLNDANNLMVFQPSNKQGQ